MMIQAGSSDTSKFDKELAAAAELSSLVIFIAASTHFVCPMLI